MADYPRFLGNFDPIFRAPPARMVRVEIAIPDSVDPSMIEKELRRAIDRLARGEPIADGGSRREAELEEALRNADAKLKEQNAVLEQLAEAPMAYAVVVGKGKKPGKLLIRRGGDIMEVNGPADVEPGRTVRVLVQTMNIDSVVDEPPATGELVDVARVVDATTCEISAGMGTRAVLTGGKKVDLGDRVVLDPSSSVVVKNLGPEPSSQVVANETGVTWDDIGGQQDAKRAMREAVEGPVIHAALYERYGRRPTKGVLLYGPPGNGKTMLGKAAATSLATLHGASAGQSGFLYIKGPELLSMWVGKSEENVRKVFEAARRHKAKHGYPAIVFIDEAEALLGRRGGGIAGAMSTSVLSGTIVPMFLAEMDGISASGALVLLATNRPDVLDPAIVREGRIDRKVRVGRPDRDDALEVFMRHVRGRPLLDGVEQLAATAVERLYDTSHALYRVHLKEGPPKTVTAAHVTSGAQIANIVDLATSLAIDRELAGGTGVGLSTDDVAGAVARIVEEQRHIDHGDAVLDFCEPFKGLVSEIERVRAPRASSPGN